VEIYKNESSINKNDSFDTIGIFSGKEFMILNPTWHRAGKWNDGAQGRKGDGRKKNNYLKNLD